MCSSLDLPAEAESGNAAVPVTVVAAAAAAPVQPGARAPEDAAGRAADGAPEAAAASAGSPLLLHAGHGARQAEGPEGGLWRTHKYKRHNLQSFKSYTEIHNSFQGNIAFYLVTVHYNIRVNIRSFSEWRRKSANVAKYNIKRWTHLHLSTTVLCKQWR